MARVNRKVSVIFVLLGGISDERRKRNFISTVKNSFERNSLMSDKNKTGTYRAGLKHIKKTYCNRYKRLLRCKTPRRSLHILSF